MDTIFNAQIKLHQDEQPGGKSSTVVVLENGYQLHISSVTDVYHNGKRIHRARGYVEALKWVASNPPGKENQDNGD